MNDTPARSWPLPRRDFLAGAAAAAGSSLLFGSASAADPGEKKNGDKNKVGKGDALGNRTYESPEAARQAPREKLAYVACLYVGTGVEKPDYLAVVDLDPESSSYSQVVHRAEMPNVGDELHHYGWNACSSCHGDSEHARRFLVVPGLGSSRIHILDAGDARRPKLHKVIEPSEVAAKTNLSAPHTVHCLADGNVMISMLGDARGQAPGGFLLLDQDFEIAGRWEKSTEGMPFNYDFWYQPRHNVMLSSQWGAPNTFRHGFNPDDVAAGKYGRGLTVWNWDDRRVMQSIDLGEQGLIPLEIRFHHNPDSPHAFIGAALSSTVWHFHPDDKEKGRWRADKILAVDPVEMSGWPFPVPSLITDLVLSLDDRWLYTSNWLHGDVRQWDVRDPGRPRLAGQVWLGGVIGRGMKIAGQQRTGGSQMLQLSLDGRRLYVTNSLHSAWDNQFYPDLAKRGSYLAQIDCDTESGGMQLNEDFFVDFGAEPGGPSRAHEVRFPNGDSTSDIWI